MQLPISVEAVGFSTSNPNWCATGGVDGILKIWDLTNNAQCRQICNVQSSEGDNDTTTTTTTTGGITQLRWHPTLPLVYTSCSDGAVRIWDARNGTLMQVLTGHTDMINTLDCNFIPTNNNNNSGPMSIIVTGSDDKTIRVFEFDVAGLAQQI